MCQSVRPANIKHKLLILRTLFEDRGKSGCADYRKGCTMQCRDNNEAAKCTRMGLIKKFDAVTPDIPPGT